MHKPQQGLSSVGITIVIANSLPSRAMCGTYGELSKVPTLKTLPLVETGPAQLVSFMLGVFSQQQSGSTQICLQSCSQSRIGGGQPQAKQMLRLQ